MLKEIHRGDGTGIVFEVMEEDYTQRKESWRTLEWFGGASDEEKSGRNSAYRTPNYAKLWSAQVFSSAADGVWLIALPLLVLDLTGSKILVGVISFIELVPLTFGMFTGPLIDSLRKNPYCMCVIPEEQSS